MLEKEEFWDNAISESFRMVDPTLSQTEHFGTTRIHEECRLVPHHTSTKYEDVLEKFLTSLKGMRYHLVTTLNPNFWHFVHMEVFHT